MTSLKDIIAEAVKEALDPVGKTEKGKKVVVGQIRDIDNDGDIDSSDEYLAYRRKKITQAMKKRDELNEQSKKSVTWGEIPDVRELEELMGDEGFDMNLSGVDSLAWEYAMTLSPNLMAGGTDTAEQLHASLEALVNAPDPDELSDEQYEEVEHVLDQWYRRYGNDRIEEAAWNLASSMMEVLGVEWI